MADVDPAIPVIFLDTGWLFEETLAYRDTLIATAGPARRALDQAAGADAVARGSGSRIVVLRSRCLLPDPQGRAAGARAGAVRRLDQRAQAFSGRRCAPLFPWSSRTARRLKFNPFANVSREEIEAIYAQAKLPPHPLAASGFLSVGCMPCTSRTSPDEDARAGPLARQGQDGMRHPYPEGRLGRAPATIRGIPAHAVSNNRALRSPFFRVPGHRLRQ